MPILATEPKGPKAPWPPKPENDPKRRTWIEYPVGKRQGESFYTIANANGLDPKELVYYNFLTRDPQVINYYLREYVGCVNADGSGYNYVFAGARNGKIYIPVSRPVPPPLVNTMPADPTDPAVAGSTFEFSYETKKKRGTTPNLVYELGLAFKAKITVLQSDVQVSEKFSNKKIGLALADKLTHDMEVGISEQMDRKFLQGDRSKGLKQTIREGFEASVKQKFAAKFVAVTVEPGLKLTDTPFFVKTTFTADLPKIDLGPYLGLAGPYVVSAQVSVTPSLSVGPSPALLQKLGLTGAEASGVAAVIGVYVGFVLFGAWYAGRAAERGAIIGKIAHYLDGYWYWLTGINTSLGRNPEEQVLFEMGQKDAEQDAQRAFGHSTQESRLFYLQGLRIMSAKRYPGLEPLQAMRRLMTEILAARLKERYGVDYPVQG